MNRLLAWTVCLVVGSVVSASAQGQLLTFDEPQSNQAMTIVCSGCTRTQYSSPPAQDWSLGDLSLTAVGATLRLRSEFDDRSPSPSPYRFIRGNVAQIAGSQLRVDFPAGTDRFGFGAALDATSAPAQMTVELTAADGAPLGSYTVPLQRSSSHNGNSNSEGVFFVSGIGQIRSATITNLGDPAVPASLNNWVIDNIQYALAAPAGAPGPAGPAGSKGDAGDPASLPQGMLLYLVHGAPVPPGFLFIAQVGAVDIYVKL